MATYRLDVEYEGTRYHGWQVQKNARSVAGAVLDALGAAGVQVRELGGSGRTDAGVHALGQVAHLRLEQPVDPLALRGAVNDALPPDIHVTSLLPAQGGFHARHDAVSRSYLYQIALRRTAFSKRFVWWVKEPFVSDRVAEAAAALVGRHDFARFCERPAEQASTIVVLDEARIVPADGLLLVRLTASHFLWKMARRIVGTLVRVGTGEVPPGIVAELLAGEARSGASPAAWTAPPSGLFLERVRYPGEAGLAEPRPAFPVAAEDPAGTRFTGDARGRGARKARR